MVELAPAFPNVVVLAGGVGGAKLVEGLASVLAPERLTVIVNTADDFTHLGMYVCPDLDTITYTLAGIAHRGQGWGIAEETFSALSMVKTLGGPSWFQLGDRDLGTHLVRTAKLNEGERLTSVTRAITRAHGIAQRILPMSDLPFKTQIETLEEGTLDFQSWLVGRRGEPRVRALRFEGEARATTDTLEAIEHADLVVVAPSNPYVSIDPILALEGVRARLAGKRVIAVSPIVRGRAVKGPLATMIPDLAGEPPSGGAIARHYGALLGALVVEHGDEERGGVPMFGASTVMKSIEDRSALARAVLERAVEAFA
jgi:LPPG:FO 2-phospho-L-lactate transferase